MDAKQAQSLTSFAALSAYVASVVVISGQMAERVPDPYMDEVFHIAQAQAYCQGRWLEWDPKITTPPGLYIAPALLHGVLPSWFSCSTDRLRWTNAALLCAMPLLLSRILSHFRTTPYPPKPGVKPRVRFLIPEDDIIFEAIVISCFPIAYFSGFLFYTDLGSLLAVLACYDQSLVGHHLFAALLGAWSCFFRQTNVIWVAFIAGSALVNRLKNLTPATNSHPLKPANDEDRGKRRAGVRSYDQSLMDSSLLDLPPATCSLASETAQNIFETLPVILPYASVMACFGVFALWNGGIVLGDRSNHTPVLHIPQLYYFAGFSLAFLAPVSFDRALIKRSMTGLFGSTSAALKSLVMCAVMIWTVYKYTYEHPFLLSDNRHYTFYVWRRVYKLHGAVRYVLVPVYILCAKLGFERLARSYTTNLLTTMFYIIALGLTLVPTPLIEPRYFLVPYVLLRLHVRPVVEEARTWPVRLLVEGCLYGLVNVVTIAVFLYRPFKGQPGEWDGAWQRFMW